MGNDNEQKQTGLIAPGKTADLLWGSPLGVCNRFSKREVPNG
jgi:hypothetical protein